MDHIGAVLSVAHRILGDVCFGVSQFQVVAGVEHSAVCISSSAYQAVAALLGCCNKHFRSVKMFCQQSLGDLRSEVSKVYAEGITTGFFDILESLDHMDLALDDTDGIFVDVCCIIFFCVSVHKSFSSVYRQGLRETITAHCHDTNFYFGNVVHC